MPHGRGKKKSRKSSRRAQESTAINIPTVPQATGAAAAAAAAAVTAASASASLAHGEGASCKQGGRELVSIVTPTRGKTQKLLPLLYNSFSRQTYEPKELIILDTSRNPANFFDGIKDERVYYVHTKKNLTLGSKRNLLASLANGTILAHFDDDDWYAPNYLEIMISSMTLNPN